MPGCTRSWGNAFLRYFQLSPNPSLCNLNSLAFLFFSFLFLIPVSFSLFSHFFFTGWTGISLGILLQASLLSYESSCISTNWACSQRPLRYCRVSLKANPEAASRSPKIHLTNLGQDILPVFPFPQWYRESDTCLCTDLTSQEWRRSASWHFCDITRPARDLLGTCGGLTGG